MAFSLTIRPHLAGLWFCLFLFLGVTVAHAQEQAPVCPVPSVRDTVSAGRGALPVLTPSVDFSDFLARISGSFLYDTGEPGWPDGWSFLGVNPNQVGLRLEGVPYTDLITGAPRFEWLPTDLLDSVQTGAVRPDRPVGVETRFRRFESTRPLTELRYRSGAGSLQAITAVHVQQRHWKPFGKEGIAQILGSYGGRGSGGIYPGSRLRRERKLYGRIRFTRNDWWVELSGYRLRHEVGAHGGVIPEAGNFNLIYQPFSASVINSGATRLTNRADVYLKLHAKLLPLFGAPLDVTAFRTGQTSRYQVTEDADTMQARRYGVVAFQPLVERGPYVRFESWVDAFSGTGQASAFDGKARTHLYAAAGDSLSLGGWRIPVEVGVLQQSGNLSPAARFALSAPLTAGVRFFTEGTLGAIEDPPVLAYGLGTLIPEASQAPGRLVHGRGGFDLRGGAFDLLLFAFAGSRANYRDLFITRDDDPDTLAIGGAFTRTTGGMTFDAGWRRQQQRGLYATVNVTAQQDVGEGPLVYDLPKLSGSGRLGARFVLFKGDLDTDLYLFGRYWTAFRSRRLHPPTGMLVVPTPEERDIPLGGVIDAYAEAKVRTATLFFAYENILSGTVIQPGVYQVPIYPLPAQAFRFGVHWPIFD